MSEDKVTQFATTEDLAQRVKIKLKRVHKRIDSLEESRSSTDTATTSANGLMSAADKAKLDGIDLTNYVVKDGDKVLSTNDFTDYYKSKLDEIIANS